MSLQYLSDENGHVVDALASDLPSWQKDPIDLRLTAIAENPDRVLPINGLLAEFDRDDK